MDTDLGILAILCGDAKISSICFISRCITYGSRSSNQTINCPRPRP